jgi:hypothetical protein
MIEERWALLERPCVRSGEALRPQERLAWPVDGGWLTERTGLGRPANLGALVIDSDPYLTCGEMEVVGERPLVSMGLQCVPGSLRSVSRRALWSP